GRRAAASASSQCHVKTMRTAQRAVPTFLLVDSTVASTVGTVNLRSTKLLLLIALFAPLARSQTQSESPSPAPGATPFEETIMPTFETQKLARTYILDIPAPRGQITDRNGAPLAQNKLSYNLAINYPTPLDFSDGQLLSFAHEKIQAAEKLL